MSKQQIIAVRWQSLDAIGLMVDRESLGRGRKFKEKPRSQNIPSIIGDNHDF